MSKFNDIYRLAEQHGQRISSSPAAWMDYLDTASRLYRYSFADNVLIHAQRPDAIACAELELWNNTMRRWVNRGAKGIALIDDSSSRNRLRYVFDISDTHMVKGGRTPYLWTVDMDQRQALTDHLTDSYGLDWGNNATLSMALMNIAAQETAENIEEAILGFFEETAGSRIAGRSMDETVDELYNLVQNTVYYVLARRCGLDPLELIATNAFEDISDFNTLGTLTFVGNAAHEITEPVLRDIGRVMARLDREKMFGKEQKAVVRNEKRAYNRFNVLKRESEAEALDNKEQGGKDNERSDEDQLSPERGLPVSRSGDAGKESGSGEIRDAEEDIPERAQEELVPEYASDREASGAFAGDRSGSRGETGSDHGSDGRERGSDRGIESVGSVAVDPEDEQYQEPGRRDRSEGAGVQLEPEQDPIAGIGAQLTAESEEDISETEVETASVLDLPELPSVDQQIRAIEERVAAEYDGFVPIPADVIDDILRTGGNRDRSQLRIIYNYMIDQAPESYADFLKREYGTGGKGLVIGDKHYSVWFDDLGMEIVLGHTVHDFILDRVFLHWDEVSIRVQQLLAQGEYAPQSVLDAARPNALREHAEVLAYMERDMAEGVAELVFSDMELFRGGFPEMSERISEYLSHQENVDDLVGRLEGFSSAYSRDPSVMRFRFYQPDRVLEQFQKFAKPAIPYMAREGFAWNEHEIFITEDEIDAFLAGGGAYADGRLATYAHYCQSEPHSVSADFLKDRYGIGGRSHALSGADHSNADYGSKGITLSREQIGKPAAEVKLTWSKAAKRVTRLIESDRFLTAKDHEQMPVYEREQMAKQVVSFYANLPQDIERPDGITGTFLSYSDIEKLASLIEDPEILQELVQKMQADHVALTDFELADDKAEILNRIRGYAEGTYTLFPAVDLSGNEPSADTPEQSDQMNIFDLISSAEETENGPESAEEPKVTTVSVDEVEIVSEEQEIEDPEVITIPEDEIKTVTDGSEPGIPESGPEHGAQEHAPVNYRITNDDLGAGGPKAKFRANMDAIHMLKILESEDRMAEPEEQEILSGYVGWGGIPQAFDENNQDWSREYAEVKETLTEEEYRAARASTLNAFYTSPTVIKAMYEALGNMGLNGGNLLEPSCGIGNFMGLVPEDMQDIRMYGVEIDSISGRIARQLYQKNQIAIQGFETTDFPDSFFDCVIGNVPFGQYQLPDRRYDRHGFLIHDYFLAKSLDLVRPGGVVAVVTSSGTMDKQNASVRKYLAERADLLGAIRLPNNAFMRNAGTGVVADILFLQKRDRAALTEPAWVHLTETEAGHLVNAYFARHPEMVLGELTTESTQYGRQEVTVHPIEGADLAEQLHEAVSRIEGAITEYEIEDTDLIEDTSIPADPSVKNFSFTEIDGAVYYRENSRMNRMELPMATAERVLGMIRLRDLTQQLLQIQLEDGSDSEIRLLQQELDREYDAFTKRYGLINSTANKRAFSQDSSYCLLCSLEVLDENGELERKADIFTKRTIQKAEPVTSVDTASEALALSIGEKAKVDVPFMAELSGLSEEEVVSDLTGVIFLNPLTDAYEPADEYLSGNVREKLRVAETFAESDDRYAVNVEHLRQVQPKELDASEIEVRLGATWIDPAYITQFMGETFHTPKYLLGDYINVQYAEVNGMWNISGKTRDSYGNALVTSTYGTSRVNAYRLLEDALNLKDTKIFDTVTDDEGREKRVLNKKETMLAQQKQEMIRDAFKEWIFRDMERREEICRKYNELFNSIRPREYDGSHIQFVGMTPEITLMPHQKDAIAHILYGDNTLLAHCVGAGKTYQMVAAGMESRRLGLAQKCLYVVPNHLTEQWGSDFLRLYPNANILVATKKDFEPANRKKFCSRIATGDYDAIIIGHSQFERIPLSIERQIMQINRQIDDIQLAIAEAADEEGSRYTIKQMEKTRRTLETKLQRLNDRTRKDDVVTFEQLGVDRLFVDESHAFKNLFIYTKMRNVAGIAQTDAQKSSDMFAKCQYLDEITGGKGVTFATGTPISNSMVEMYTIMRYLQYSTLQKMGLGHFDSWAASFGETVTAIELSPEGTGYRAKTRFAKFYNLPELISLFKECADIQTADMLNLPVPEAEYVNEVLKPSEEQKDLVSSFAERAERVRNRIVEPHIDNMLKITNDGRKCALDQRLINDMLPDDSDSKVNRCVENAYQVWEETAEDRSAQLIFCDLSTPKADGSFNVYDDLKEKLMRRGVPEGEIAFIHDANTEARKAELFARVRSGQVRILLGSTQKLGAGTNVQDRLVALHHLDCPWKPSDLEQQEGRILRQGNHNDKVKIFRYVTEGTFDSYMWQILENKQKFISQIMTSKSPVRSCEDVDEATLTYAEIKALATGNPHIKEKMDLDIQVSKLKLMKANHTSNRYRLETDLAKNYPAQQVALEERIEGLKQDVAAAAAVLEKKEKDQFEMTVGAKTLADKKEAGTALIAACAGLKAVGTTGRIGTYEGFTMMAGFDSFHQVYNLTLRGKCSHTIEIGKDPIGNIQRIQNCIAGIEKKLVDAEQRLENLHSQVRIAEEEVKKPFPQETELKEKQARLSELNALLNMDGNGIPVTEAEEEVVIDVEEGRKCADDVRRPAGRESLLGRLSEKKALIAARESAGIVPGKQEYSLG